MSDGPSMSPSDPPATEPTRPMPTEVRGLDTTPPLAAVDAPLAVVGEYELLEELGHGGMGVVYRARQPSLNRVVALKMIRSGRFAAPADVQRFRLEAEAVAQLDHPNIVPIYEVGEQDGRPFFTMKLIDGGSLASVIVPGQGARHDEVAALMATVARAVHHAHQRGILHRDLKPGNILLASGEGEKVVPAPLAHPLTPNPSPPPGGEGNRTTGGSRPKLAGLTPHVTDFGLAKRIQGDSGMTQSGAILGTPSYLPPEQARGEKTLTTAADVYSLGAILYECLTGRPPFLGESPLDTLQQVVNRDPVPPRQVDRRVPLDLETICLKCLQKSPARRYRSAADLADDLDRYRAGKPIEARPVRAWERLIKSVRRRPAIAGLTTALAVVTTLGVALLVWMWRDAADQRLQALEARAQAEAASDRAESIYHVSRIQAALRDYRANALRDARGQLQACPPSRRGWEWNYVSRLCHPELLTIRLPEGAEVRALAWSPDGTRLAVAAWNVVQVHDSATGQVLSGGGRADSWRSAVAFDPKNATLARGTWKDKEGVVVVSDLATGAERYRQGGHVEAIDCLAYSPDGRWLAAGAGKDVGAGQLVIRDARTGALHHDLKGHQNSVFAAQFDPTSRVLTSLSLRGEWKRWDVTTGQELPSAKVRPWLQHAALSPGGDRVAVVQQEKKSIEILDVATGKRLATIPVGAVHLNRSAGLAFSPQGDRLVTLEGDDRGAVPMTVRLWDVATTKELARLRADTVGLSASAVSPDGKRLALGNTRGQVQIFDLDRSEGEARRYPGSEPPVRIKDRDGREVTTSLTKHVHGCAFSGNGRRIIADLDGSFEVFDVASGRSEFLFVGRDAVLSMDGSQVTAITRYFIELSPKGRIYRVGDAFITLETTDVRTGQVVHVWRGHQAAVRRLVASPDRQRLASIDDARVVHVWDVATRRSLAHFRFPGDEGVGNEWLVRFSPDGTKLVCCYLRDGMNKKAVLFDVAAGREAYSFACPPDVPLDAAILFSPDGRWLVGPWHLDLNERTPRVPVRDVATGREDADLVAPALEKDPSIGSLLREGAGAFSPDGRLLALAFGRTVIVWDFTEGSYLRTLAGHQNDVTRLVFVDEGRRLLTASLDGDVKVWDVRGGHELLSLREHRAAVRALAVSPDGQLVVTGGDDGVVRVWDGTPLR